MPDQNTENIQLQSEIVELNEALVAATKECKRLRADVAFWKDGHREASEEIQRCVTALSELMYVGNRLARGEATADEWHEAVGRAIPDHAKPTVCKREDDDDFSGT